VERERGKKPDGRESGQDEKGEEVAEPLKVGKGAWKNRIKSLRGERRSQTRKEKGNSEGTGYGGPEKRATATGVSY